MAIVNGSLELGYKNLAWFTANPTLVLKEGQIVYLGQTGTYKIGDGVSALSVLSFLGISSETQTLQNVTDLGNTTTNNIEANAFVKTGGLYTEFLKADGSVDTNQYVVVEAGKGLSENDFTDADKTKLDGIEAGAEVNVNADWNATSGDAQIFNKPTIPIQAVPVGGTAGQILAKVDDTDYNLEWIENYANYTSTLKHNVKASVALTKGQAVYVSGASGTNMLVSKASNASEPTSSKTLGLIAQDLAINGQGFVITEGLLAGLNTSTATIGDPVWLGVDGALIYGLASKPYAPAHLVFIGIVTRVSATVGEIFVKVQNGFELKEIHDVDLISSSPTDGQVLTYEASSGLWKNKTITSSSTAVRTPYTFIATAGQTVFTTVGYTVGQIDVYYNGSKQIPSEYTATNGTTVVFATGKLAGDEIEIVVWKVSDVASTLTLDTSGFGEDKTFNATTNTLTIDKYSWMDLARGYTVEPTLFTSTATYEVYTYVYSTSTLYRKIMNDGSVDAFYSESGLINLLCSKKIIL